MWPTRTTTNEAQLCRYADHQHTGPCVRDAIEPSRSGMLDQCAEPKNVTSLNAVNGEHHEANVVSENQVRQ